MIREVINSLIDYASIHLGLEGLDRVYARNIVLGELGLEYPSDKAVFSIEEIEKMEVPKKKRDILIKKQNLKLF